MSELGHDEPGEGLVVPFRKLDEVEKVAELIDGKQSIEQPGAIVALDRAGLLVFSAPCSGTSPSTALEDVVEGEHADHRAKLVEHHGGVG